MKRDMHQVFVFKSVLELYKLSTYFSQEVEFVADEIEIEITPNFTSPTQREVSSFTKYWN
jgi:hypothetical protein